MKKLTVNESLKIAMHNRDAKIHDLECENLALRIDTERLREMVLRYVTIGAVLQDDLNLVHNCEQGHCNHYLAHSAD